jgi:hypothetical protein
MNINRRTEKCSRKLYVQIEKNAKYLPDTLTDLCELNCELGQAALRTCLSVNCSENKWLITFQLLYSMLNQLSANGLFF